MILKQNSRYVKPCAIFAKTKERYSGRALSNMPIKIVYDFTVALSRVIQGILTIASTSVACVLSIRETTCVRAASQRRISAVSTLDWVCLSNGSLEDDSDVVAKLLNCPTSSSKG